MRPKVELICFGRGEGNTSALLSWCVDNAGLYISGSILGNRLAEKYSIKTLLVFRGHESAAFSGIDLSHTNIAIDGLMGYENPREMINLVLSRGAKQIIVSMGGDGIEYENQGDAISWWRHHLHPMFGLKTPLASSYLTSDWVEGDEK